MFSWVNLTEPTLGIHKNSLNSVHTSLKNYRYTLIKTSKKSKCPECGNKTLVRYIDNQMQTLLQEDYGRCDREVKCGYHLNPYNSGYNVSIRDGEKKENGALKKHHFSQVKKKPNNKPLSFIPFEILRATRKGWEQNIFIQNILYRMPFPFNAMDIEKVIALYHLGTVCKGYRAGAITFPYIDIKGNVRTIQVKQFDQTNHTTSTDFLHSMIEKDCKCNKEPYPGWLTIYLLNHKFVTCFFGEHLLNKYPSSPIALVEAPKTAILATLYFGIPENPKEMIWLAVYNLSSLSLEKCRILQGRKVFLYPDLNAYQKWSRKANELTQQLPGTIFKVSNLLELHASEEEKAKGLDLADYLTKLDWRKFRPEKANDQATLDQIKPHIKSSFYLNSCGQGIKRKEFRPQNLTKLNNFVLSDEKITEFNYSEMLIKANNTSADLTHSKRMNVGLEAFEKWLNINPAGGVFKIEGKNYKIQLRF